MTRLQFQPIGRPNFGGCTDSNMQLALSNWELAKGMDNLARAMERLTERLEAQEAKEVK